MIDCSVDTGDIEDHLSSETIRQKIRDEYLRDAEVTILLCGSETRFRKHVDWELKSSMIDGSKNRRSGILVIDLPSSDSTTWHVGFPEEKRIIYPSFQGTYTTVNSMKDYEQRFPNMPKRILENLMNAKVAISVVPWESVYGYEQRFQFLLERTAKSRFSNEYDLSRPMRRKNFNPTTELFDVRT